MLTKQIIPTAEPFFMQGGKTACLVIHGFTGAPKEMRPIAEALHKQGLTVMGIRLAGHATHVEDMQRIRYRDWLASVEDGINLLMSAYERVFLVGLSMGGVLALSAASYNEVDGVVALAAPFALNPDWRLKIIRLISLFIPWKKKSHKSKDKKNSDHIDYPVYPTISIAELNDLTKVMQQEIHRIKAPVLLIYSKSDTQVPIINLEKIKSRLTTDYIEELILEKSGHVITEDVESEIAFAAAYRFIEKFSQS